MLLLTIFFLVFATELISWVGQSVLLDLALALYLRLFHTTLASKQAKLKADILTNKTELLQTSAQDQFAKWAKLRRTVDKGLSELEALNGQIASIKQSFSLKFNSALWIATTGSQFFVSFWYGRSAVFYLPQGWFGPVAWWFSLPFAPRGSVSVGVWSMACKRVIKIGERVVRDFATPSPVVPDQKASGEKKSL